MDAMVAKQEDPRSKRRGKPNVPSTGSGAASAMDALIKKRVPAPGGDAPPPPPRSAKKH